MKSKLLLIALMLVFFSIFSFSYVFATNGEDNIVNGIRNFVGGTENVVENVGTGIAGAIGNGMNTIGNGVQNVTNDVSDGMNNNDTMIGTTGNDNNGDYTATRTGAETDVTVAGIPATTWIWIVIIAAAIAIGVLIWSYVKGNSYINTSNNNDYDE